MRNKDRASYSLKKKPECPSFVIIQVGVENTFISLNV